MSKEYSSGGESNTVYVDRGAEPRDYYRQDLGKVWTFPGYKKYEAARWSWLDLPFADDLSQRRYLRTKVTRRIEGKSILEVGSAMGGAYAFMKESGLVDLSRYTGLEVSDMGHEGSKQRFPEANWVHADFTRHVLPQKYDYIYERIAVHHMPEPLTQFRKMLEATNEVMMTTFRGCLRGRTVSDLSRSFFRTREDRYFCNIINLYEVVNLGLDLGFDHVCVIYAGLHEPISSDPTSQQYLDPAITAEDRHICRLRVRFSRLPAGRAPKIYVTVGGLRVLAREFPAIMGIQRELSAITAGRARTG